jgi:GGDEF domain-containing protein
LRLRVKFLVFAVDSYIDIDSVKQVNNKLGHAAGDYLLRYIARSMKKNAAKN